MPSNIFLSKKNCLVFDTLAHTRTHTHIQRQLDDRKYPIICNHWRVPFFLMRILWKLGEMLLLLIISLLSVSLCIHVWKISSKRTHNILPTTFSIFWVYVVVVVIIVEPNIKNLCYKNIRARYVILFVLWKPDSTFYRSTFSDTLLHHWMWCERKLWMMRTQIWMKYFAMDYQKKKVVAL